MKRPNRSGANTEASISDVEMVTIKLGTIAEKLGSLSATYSLEPHPDRKEIRHEDPLQSESVVDRDTPMDVLVEAITEEQFKLAFRNHPAGVAVVTADAGDGPIGFTATSVFSVSVAPPLLAFSVTKQSSSAASLQKVDTIVIHLLGSDQVDLAVLCAKSGVDRFGDSSNWMRLPTGEPCFPAAYSWIRGRIIKRIEAGESTIVIAQALQTNQSFSDEGDSSRIALEPLVYHNRTWHRLNQASKIIKNQ